MAQLKYTKNGVPHDLPIRGAVSSVNGRTGVVTGLAEEIDVENKLDKNQGTANAGKLLGVGENGNITPTDKEVFYAEYGVTTYDEITNALASGATVYCLANTYAFPFARTLYNQHRFGNIDGASSSYARVNTQNVWSASYGISLEQTYYKATDLSAASTNDQYPSAKCVYNYALRDWVGTQAEYDAIAIKDSHTRYSIVEATT